MGKPIAHLSDLTPDPRNARAHNPRNVGMIESALNEVGAARSIVIDEDGVVLAGNATIEAAAQAGIERVQVVEADGETIIAVRRRGLTPEQKVKLALFDNRAAELAEWDTSVLAELSAEIDLSQLFRDDELSELLAGVGAPDVGGAGDDAPTIDEDKPTRVQPGDVWRVGEHLVACLDSTEPGNLDRVLAGRRPQMITADPPYGMSLDTDYTSHKLSPAARAKHPVQNTHPPVAGDNEEFNPSLFLEMFRDTQEQFWWGADYYRGYLPGGGSWLVWDKRASVEHVEYDTSSFELCWSKTRHRRDILRIAWFGIIGMEQEQGRRVHPTQKPIALYEALFRHGRPGDLILDPFLGSGPSLKAAHRMGDRRVVGFELSPHYCDHILEWAEAAGLTCTRVEE